MNKYTFKQCLAAIDRLEIQGLTPMELKTSLFDFMKNKEFPCDLIDMLLELKHIVQFGAVCDLNIPITVFARAPHNSISESLAFIESMMYDKKSLQIIESKLDHSFESNDFAVLFQNHEIWSQILIDLSLFEQKGSRFFIRKKIKRLIQDIIKERVEYPQLLSSITLAYFIRDITHLKKVPFRNQNMPIMRYPNHVQIMAALPYYGVPEKRDASEGLQNFFKDCLFHEFEHQCSFCGIAIPQMLIASHIKPFRDCGHIIEAADHNNGILLCKNHDFLFDQGYLSIDQDGKIMVASCIEPTAFDRFVIDPSFIMAKRLMTPIRQQFLLYHRSTYFQK